MNNDFLHTCSIIDWQHETILKQAQLLAHKQNSQSAIAKACFEFVRDKIKHSGDFQLNPVTCKASDVLQHKTGYCYAKSHLLAALLRANQIPAGLCYQRLSTDAEKPAFCLHGLNAVYLENTGWYKVDARGNKKGINAQFNPPTEQLAFPITLEGEFDLPHIYAKPLAEITDVLNRFGDYREVWQNLPDISTRMW